MLRSRFLATVLVLFGAIAAFAPGALAAEGVGPAKKLGGGETSTATTTTSTSRTADSSKETLTIATTKPVGGQTLSGTVAWEIGIVAGAPTKVEFFVDGSVQSADANAPFASSLDTTKLANGSHSLSATAYGAKGVKATTKATVTVSNAAPAPEPAPEPAPAPSPTPAPGAGPIYWGATIGSQLTGTQAPWDMSAVTKFEEMTHKSVSMVQFYQPFANCSSSPCSFYPFPKGPMELIRNHGSIPVLSWASQSTPSSVNEPNFQLADVTAGKYDAFIRTFAEAAKAWNHPFFLRFNFEMNGSWFPWSERVNGNHGGDYVAAWRHVHDIFAAVGATNVTWVWCPNVDPDNVQQSLASLYPGDAYVDWTGLDGYNWGTNPAKPDRWRSFRDLYRSTYAQIAEKIAPSKPMMVAEVASSEYGGSKAAWIKDMLARIPAEFPKIRALLWFDKLDDGMDWPVETSSSATTAVAEGVSSSAYLGNSFASLSPSAILPAG
jgi:hypothetical protein